MRWKVGGRLSSAAALSSVHHSIPSSPDIAIPRRLLVPNLSSLSIPVYPLLKKSQPHLHPTSPSFPCPLLFAPFQHTLRRMADTQRPPHRGGGRGGRGEHRGGRGGGGRSGHEGGGRGGHAGGAGGERERPKKENILDLGKYMDKKITVKFTGGREGEFFFSFTHLQVECGNWHCNCAWCTGGVDGRFGRKRE
jgi:hypothetical protein